MLALGKETNLSEVTIITQNYNFATSPKEKTGLYRLPHSRR
jgi:hypothetical protein